MRTLTRTDLWSKIEYISERASYYGAEETAAQLLGVRRLLVSKQFDSLQFDLIPHLLDPTPFRQEISVATTHRIRRWYTARDILILLLPILTFSILLFAAGAYLGWWPAGFRSTAPLNLSLGILADFALFSSWSFCTWRIRWSKYRAEQNCAELTQQLQGITRDFFITVATDPGLPRDTSMALNMTADRIAQAVQELVDANKASTQNIQALSREVAQRVNSFDKQITPAILHFDNDVKQFYATSNAYQQEFANATSSLIRILHDVKAANDTHLSIEQDLSAQIRTLNAVQQQVADRNAATATSMSTVAQSIVNIVDQLTRQQQRISSNPAQKSANSDELEEKYTFDVYLCYDGRDRFAVKAIAEQLKTHDISPWLDEWEVRPGIPWQREIEEQLSHIKSVAIFLGREGIGPWQNAEQRAILREFVEKKHPVIPILLPGYEKKEPELPAFLKSTTWVDFRREDPDPLQTLIWGIIGKKVMS